MQFCVALSVMHITKAALIGLCYCSHLTLTLATGEGIITPRWFLQNLTFSDLRNVTVVFVTLSLANLGFRYN